MARHRAGGSVADYVVQHAPDGTLRLAANATVTGWDAPVGGNQHTDLADTTGIIISSLQADENGALPKFQLPDGSPWGPASMWADANGGAGPRRLMVAHDLDARFTANEAGLAALQGQGLGDLADVDTTGAADGDVPVFTAADGVWRPAAVAGGGASTLDGLADVAAPAPADGQLLGYDGTGGVWIPTTVSAQLALSNNPPDALGAAAAGVAGEASRADHVHPMPSAADVSAVPAAFAGGVSHRVRGAGGVWPARDAAATLTNWYETDFATPAKPAGMAVGDLYYGPDGMAGV